MKTLPILLASSCTLGLWGFAADAVGRDWARAELVGLENEGTYSAGALLEALTSETDPETTAQLQTRFLELLGVDPPVLDAYVEVGLSVDRRDLAETLLLSLRTCEILEIGNATVGCLAAASHVVDHDPLYRRAIGCKATDTIEGTRCLQAAFVATIRAEATAEALLTPLADELLMEAYSAADVPLATLALDFGAKAERYVDGEPLFHAALREAVERGYPNDMMHLLLDRADVNVANSNDGVTAFMLAARFGAPFWVMNDPQLELNLQDHDGNTALHWLIASQDDRLVEQFFVRYDAQRRDGSLGELELSIRNHAGCTPRGYARSRAVKRLLKARGAKRGRILRCRPRA